MGWGEQEKNSTHHFDMTKRFENSNPWGENRIEIDQLWKRNLQRNSSTGYVFQLLLFLLLEISLHQKGMTPLLSVCFQDQGLKQ